MDKAQTSRFSKGEMELIRNTFKNEEILYSLRNALYGFEFEEIKLSDDVFKVIEKILLPTLSNDVPLGQQADLFFSLNLKEFALPENALMHIESRDIALSYLKDRVEVLKGGEDNGFKLVDLKTAKEDRYVNMLAYFFLTNAYIDSCLMQLRTLANSKELTDEEKAELAKKSSSK